MDLQMAFNIALTMAGSLAAFVLNQLWNSYQKLHKELSELRVHLPESYVLKEDFAKFAEAIFKKLDRIEEKLDSKADK